MSIQCQILMGETQPIPLPAEFIEAIQSIEVLDSDADVSGFKITFVAGRGAGLTGGMDYPLLRSQQIQPYNRVQILVTVNASTNKLMDGIITHIELHPDALSGSAIITVTGKDLTVMMDTIELTWLYSNQSDDEVVRGILRTRYQQYNLELTIIPPPVVKTQQTIAQRSSDLELIRDLAKRWYYVFYITTGSTLSRNIAYWGPPKRVGIMQKALSVGLGPNSNVKQIQFSNNVLSATTITGRVFDSRTNQVIPVATQSSLQVPLSTSAVLRSRVRTTLLTNVPGHDFVGITAIAQAQSNAASMETLEAQGELDILRYGSILQARKLVGLRGAGINYDGEYYVKQVTHILRPGSYQQQFILARDGTGTTVPAVVP